MTRICDEILILINSYLSMVEQPAAASLINEEGKNRSIDYYAIKFPVYNFVDHKSADGAKIQNYRWPTPAEEGKAPKAVISML